jgi:hypothetical protein
VASQVDLWYTSRFVAPDGFSRSEG